MNPSTSLTYAQGLVQAALGDWLDQLEAVQRNVRHHPETMLQLADANTPPSQRETAVRSLIPASAAPEVARFVRLMAQNGDIRLLEEVLRQIHSIVPSLEDQAQIIVTSAHTLSATERDKVEAKLRADYGADKGIQYEVEPELLGGLRIQVGDRVIDHTVAARLEALRGRLVG